MNMDTSQQFRLLFTFKQKFRAETNPMQKHCTVQNGAVHYHTVVSLRIISSPIPSNS